MPHPDFSLTIVGSTLFYSIMGMFLMLAFMVVFDRVFKLNLYKELVEDQNTAFGVLFAGIAIGISIIIAASII